MFQTIYWLGKISYISALKLENSVLKLFPNIFTISIHIIFRDTNFKRFIGIKYKVSE